MSKKGILDCLVPTLLVAVGNWGLFWIVNYLNCCWLQCCGFESRILCLFDPWILVPDKVISGSLISNPGSWIPDLESWILDPGSRILDPKPIIFGVKSSRILWKLAYIFFFSISKCNCFQFCEICGYKKGMTTDFFHPSLLLLFLDPWYGMGKNQDPEHSRSATLVDC